MLVWSGDMCGMFCLLRTTRGFTQKVLKRPQRKGGRSLDDTHNSRLPWSVESLLDASAEPTGTAVCSQLMPELLLLVGGEDIMINLPPPFVTQIELEGDRHSVGFLGRRLMQLSC